MSVSLFHFVPYHSYATRNATDSCSVHFPTDADTIYKTKWPPRRLVFIRLKIVFVTILPSAQQAKVVHRDVQEV